MEEYLELVFRRAPVTRLKNAELLTEFLGDCDRWGTEFVQYARRVVSEVLSVGRCGSLVLPSTTLNPQQSSLNSPVVSFWRAEDILNWSVERVGQRSVLTRVVLRDGTRVRELRMVVVNGTDGTDGNRCVMEVWGEVDGTWGVEEQTALKRDGVALPFVPFMFHGPRGCLPERSKLPLADIIAANLIITGWMRITSMVCTSLRCRLRG